ncbi:MAG: MerR family transcriptional regulator [Acidimicrobiales bacterium]
MEYPISQVARMSGVSSRALRHYHDIGLLVPFRVSPNGYRWYQRPQVLRLQRVLLLRELGVPLSRIAEILDGETDQLTALCRHRQQLLDERDRLQRVIDTVCRTIATLSGDGTLSDEDFFAGLAEGKHRLLQDLGARFDVAAREHFDAAERATAAWARHDYERAAADGRQLLRAMSEARMHGVAPHDDDALDLVAQHHAQVATLWPADGASYYALGDLLLENPDQRAMIAGIDPELPPWLSVAIKTYSVQRLAYDGPLQYDQASRM